MGGGGKCLPNSSFPDTATHPESLSKPSPNAIGCYDYTVAEQSDASKAESFSFSQSASEDERESKVFMALMESYCSSRAQSRAALDDEKLAILRHKPGDWIENVAGFAVENYDIPEITTLLLIGPQGSGKSSLVNRITRAFDENSSGLDRAQVSYARTGEGTCFLQEYPIPRNSGTLCVYDTRSLSLVPSENLHLLMRWMTNGVVHGEMAFHISDDAIKKNKMKIKAKNLHGYFCKKRTVNFVILVVNGVSILESMESKETQYIDMIVQTFNSPYVAFRDNKPAVVITHGDKLSFHDRAFVRAKLGELLGIPPCMQIFDIPENTDNVTEASIVNLLRFCIENSDRNLPPKRTFWIEAQQSLKKICSIMQQQNPFEVLILFVSCFVSIYALVRIIVLQME
ncbi:hypothetical protein KFK09_012364 [Dendrobium nobile]|uniref:G domain-containing protein n=1 Tax=Dendrobium nobile TaxID=94219 RepID=A0A8T3BFA9_DENNO|nr:hypothetical protein KFK09_012364 [Dendrobium nobile]